MDRFERFISRKGKFDSKNQFEFFITFRYRRRFSWKIFDEFFGDFSFPFLYEIYADHLFREICKDSTSIKIRKIPFVHLKNMGVGGWGIKSFLENLVK